MDQAIVMNEHVSQKAVDTTLPEAVQELCRSCSSITNIFSIWDRDLLSATKWIETHRPRLGFSYVLLTSKVGNIAFPPPSSPWNVVPMFELPKGNNKHPNFEQRGQGRGADSFVLWSYPIWIQCLNNFVADCRHHAQFPAQNLNG